MDNFNELTCYECGKLSTSTAGCSQHIKGQHHMTLEAYFLKWKYNNTIPICACGCGKETAWWVLKRDFRKHIIGHEYAHITGRIKCEYCDTMILYTPRGIASHNGHYHRDKSKKLTPTVFTIECKECNLLVSNNNGTLGRHLLKIHNMKYVDYVVKHDHSGEWPLCQCGCGTKRRFLAGGFRFPFASQKCGSSGENNGMFGKAGNNGNVGKKRTPEQRDKYRKHAVRRVQAGTLSPKNTIKEWKYNPFTDKDEYMHSSWESKFLDRCIEINFSITKSHDIVIDYFDPIDNKNRSYVPDFLSIENKQLIEIKGYKNKMTSYKTIAGIDWARENGFDYIFIDDPSKITTFPN